MSLSDATTNIPPRRAGVLLSIHFSSNRPENFTRFLDRLEAATDDISSVEVVLKIDQDDVAMNRLLPQEVARRPFRIVYISTPLVGGFYELWRCYDELLKVCDPNAYFLLPLNDEMYFLTQGWDTVLRRYVGRFPDHIFRLRTSLHRFRTYFDFWEPGWSNDTSSFITKRWIDLSGGWCPCNGPDSFQQCVAFYFGWLYRFDIARPYREIPLAEIDFGGAGESIGMDGDALRRRHRGALKPWFILMSHAMQEEAARRAQKLHVHIWAEAVGLPNLEVRENRARRCMEVVDAISGAVLRRRSYRLSWLRISLSNAIRKLNYGYYGGAGDDFRHRPFYNFSEYLCLRHERLDQARAAYRTVARAATAQFRRVAIAFSRLAPAPASGPGRVLRLFSAPFRLGLHRPHVIYRGLKEPRRAIRRLSTLLRRP
ncbi:MAG TPA: hypothetical protein VG328_09040 [Stellaceae bacterium]|jgi:hypothetical protein|nr:hypothetical protein [Stellaceae bacterium]